jgi:hypothetical protein
MRAARATIDGFDRPFLGSKVICFHNGYSYLRDLIKKANLLKIGPNIVERVAACLKTDTTLNQLTTASYVLIYIY